MDMQYDMLNARHIVLYGRNVFEALQVKEANDILDAIGRGAKLTYIDIRATVTASKANRFYKIRPGTDYALSLALINVILNARLYDKAFADKWITGLRELIEFTTPYTPEWAERETGIAAPEIVRLAHEVSSAAPRVVFHAGWMVARYIDSFYSARAIYILNALMGNIEREGGLIIAKGEEDCGYAQLNSITNLIPEPAGEILDASGSTCYGSGHLVNLYNAISTGKPYPVKAWFAYRYDPILSLPDPDRQRAILDNLDLLVSIDVNMSDTGWYADVVLPEATYLERSNIIALQRGIQPALLMRRQGIAPLYDSKPAWEIFTLILEKMGCPLPFKSIEDIWEYQLRGTGINIKDFDSTGIVTLSNGPVLCNSDEIKFITQSGKVEIISMELQAMGHESLKPYVSPIHPEAGTYRLVTGRSAVHTQGQSQNNLYLNEIEPENILWIHDENAHGIKTGDMVEVSSNGASAAICAYATPFIHPEAVFMLHGFGNEIPIKTRAFGRGVKASQLQRGMLDRVDSVGGGVAYFDTVVKVKRLESQ
ncbi:MAG: molybdopterin-dependent oxidoreductase [Nitrospirae bacterium]|nr:molybdopterin-dependent oxidoreductase [Nitrospirota bacterium]